MFDEVARRLLEPVNTSVISILGLFNVLLGIWVLLPFDSLIQTSTLVPEFVLGIITLIIGVLIVWGSFRENMNILKWGTGAGFIEWIGLMGVVIYLNWKSTGWIVALMVSAYCGFVHLNIQVNRKNLLNKKE